MNPFSGDHYVFYPFYIRQQKIAQALRSSFIPCTQSLHQSTNTSSVSLCHSFQLLKCFFFFLFFFLIFILNCFLNIPTILQLYRNLPLLEGIVLPAILPNFGSFVFYFILQLSYN